MATVNRFDDLVNAPAEDRKQIAERLYDETYAKRLRQSFKAPTRGRLKKIALYKQIIGTGNRCILELGCGSGDLTYALVDNAQKVVATDISANALELAGKRKELWSLESGKIEKIEFKPMSAVQLDFPDATFHWVISTSMIEHLHPDDVSRHLREVWRVLEAGGNYLIWCPNGLGHHEDRGGHLTMLSYKEWTEKLGRAVFHRFRSTLTSRLPLADARWKIAVETILSRLRIKLLWSHLGVRNVLLVATK
ncbi:MAG TPA: class I SAM-dependent methyltransferase [Bryobacteraceae bacterium]